MMEQETTILNQEQLLEPEPFVFYLRVDPYLAQWIAHENKGDPVMFPNNSVENDVIELGLIEPPEGARRERPGVNKIAITLPFFKYKDASLYSYLPPKAKSELTRCIKARFAVALWKDLYKFGYIGKKKQDLIWAWMESHGIEATETNFNTIVKIYARKRDVYRKKVQRKHKKP